MMKIIKKIIGMLIILFSVCILILTVIGVIESNDDLGTKLGIIIFWLVIQIICIIFGIYLIKDKNKVKDNYSNIEKCNKEESLQIEEYDIYYCKENVKKYAQIISNDKIENYDFINEDMSLEDFALRLTEIDDGFLLYFDWKETLDSMIWQINELMKKLDYNIKVTEKQVMDKDIEYNKNRGKDYVITTDHDLNIINNILENKGYKLIVLPIDADGYWLAIIPTDKVKEIELLKGDE